MACDHPRVECAMRHLVFSQPVMLDDVREFVIGLANSYNRAEVVYDPFQAINIGQQLQRDGVRHRPFRSALRAIVASPRRSTSCSGIADSRFRTMLSCSTNFLASG